MDCSYFLYPLLVWAKFSFLHPLKVLMPLRNRTSRFWLQFTLEMQFPHEPQLDRRKKVHADASPPPTKTVHAANRISSAWHFCHNLYAQDYGSKNFDKNYLLNIKINQRKCSALASFFIFNIFINFKCTYRQKG